MATVGKNFAGQARNVNVFFQDSGLVVFSRNEDKVVLKSSNKIILILYRRAQYFLLLLYYIQIILSLFSYIVSELHVTKPLKVKKKLTTRISCAPGSSLLILTAVVQVPGSRSKGEA